MSLSVCPAHLGDGRSDRRPERVMLLQAVQHAAAYHARHVLLADLRQHACQQLSSCSRALWPVKALPGCVARCVQAAIEAGMPSQQMCQLLEASPQPFQALAQLQRRCSCPLLLLLWAGLLCSNPSCQLSSRPYPSTDTYCIHLLWLPPCSACNGWCIAKQCEAQGLPILSLLKGVWLGWRSHLAVDYHVPRPAGRPPRLCFA